MAKRYRLKRVVEAIQFTGSPDNVVEIVAFCGRRADGSNRAWHQVYGEMASLFVSDVAAHGGPVEVEKGWWIGRDTDDPSELHLYAPGFATSWEEVA